MVVYNWHDVPSNKFYRSIGGEVLKQMVQKPFGKEALVDIFYWDMSALIEVLNKRISEKPTKVIYEII